MKKLFIIISLVVILSLGIVINNKKYKVDSEYLSIFIDNERVSEFPKKGEALYLKSSCDSDTSLEWDNTSWGLYVGNLDKKVKCNIYFQKTLGGSVRALAKEDNINLASDDPDSNIRYIGSNPDNYVYFNCSDYNNQSDSTCEKWRIIGLFNNVTKSDNTKENLIRIVRNESVGEFSWDTSLSSVNSGNGINNWIQSRLMKLLNTGYESENIGGSLYYNAKSGNCYAGQNNATTSCDFSTTGLKNDETRNAIETVIWNLGGISTYDDRIVSNAYKLERGSTVYNDNPISWTGKIGLIYPSDYGYAAGGGSSTDRNSCLNASMYSWSDAAYSDCVINNYLHKDDLSFWGLTVTSANETYPFVIYSSGNVAGGLPSSTNDVYPALYLKSDILITSGHGSEESPYQLGLS